MKRTPRLLVCVFSALIFAGPAASENDWDSAISAVTVKKFCPTVTMPIRPYVAFVALACQARGTELQRCVQELSVAAKVRMLAMGKDELDSFCSRADVLFSE